MAFGRFFNLIRLNACNITTTMRMSTVSKCNQDLLKSVVCDAERLVGYPTSFLEFRFLLSDEFSHLALELRKLAGTGHPLLRTARALLGSDEIDAHGNSHSRGLVVMLIAKAAGQLANTPVAQLADGSEDECVDGLLHSQRQLAEITDVIYTATLMHRDVVDLNKTSLNNSEGRADLIRGNKLATLSGDYLLASASRGLASLGRPRVVELMSQAICDLMESEFDSEFDKEPLLTSWQHYARLGAGSLLAHSCQGALFLSHHCIELQLASFRFGQALAMAQRLHKEIHAVTSQLCSASSNLEVYAPLSLPRRLSIHGVEQAAVISQCKSLLVRLVATAESELQWFSPSESRDTLYKLLHAFVTH